MTEDPRVAWYAAKMYLPYESAQRILAVLDHARLYFGPA